jgi:two-component system sensor histidine kinase/response regulator
MAKRVLVVEDREDDRAGMESLFRSHGFDVLTAPDGAKALNLLATNVPDLITLDMLMPESDGWYFLKERMEVPSLLRIPVLLVTGLLIATEAWAADISASGLVKKPVDVDELMRKVEWLAGR